VCEYVCACETFLSCHGAFGNNKLKREPAGFGVIWLAISVAPRGVLLGGTGAHHSRPFDHIAGRFSSRQNGQALRRLFVLYADTLEADVDDYHRGKKQRLVK
tara:strand:- start:1139 stop:1444 length:306 start_codon:yes stop_codon:yes gene_type:complete